MPAHGLDPTPQPKLAFLTGAGPAPDSSNPGAPQPALAETLAGLRAAKAVVALVCPDAAAAGGASGTLGPAALPVLVEMGGGEGEESIGWEVAAEELDDAFLGDATVWRRPSAGPSGPDSGVNPRGGPIPYITPDGGATLLDVVFETELQVLRADAEDGEPSNSYEDVLAALKTIPGFIDAGLVPGSARGAATAAVVAGVGPGGAPVVVEV